VAYAIGIARDDQVLMDLAFGSISGNNEDNDELLGIVRDIDRLVVFMKAAKELPPMNLAIMMVGICVCTWLYRR
jgi:hypothetical protein